MIRRQKIKRIQREKKTFRREYIPLIFAVILLIGLVVALVYAIMYRPDKSLINELYSMETEELPVDVTSLACDNSVSSNIQKDANNIKVRYEEIDDYYFGKTMELDYDDNGDGVIGEVDDIGYALKVVISGITENIYIDITNNVDGDYSRVKYSDTDNGAYSFDQIENAYVRTYNIKIYSSVEECGDILFREFNFVLPRLNNYAYSDFCQDNRSLEICKPFIYEKDERQFFEKYKKVVDETTQKKETVEEEKKGINDFIKEYKKQLIVGGVIVFVLLAVLITKRSR